MDRDNSIGTSRSKSVKSSHVTTSGESSSEGKSTVSSEIEKSSRDIGNSSMSTSRIRNRLESSRSNKVSSATR